MMKVNESSVLLLGSLTRLFIAISAFFDLANEHDDVLRKCEQSTFVFISTSFHSLILDSFKHICCPIYHRLPAFYELYLRLRYDPVQDVIDMTFSQLTDVGGA
jgi:hypothetical protein